MPAYRYRFVPILVFLSLLVSACQTPAPKAGEQSVPAIFLWKILDEETGATEGWLLGYVHIGESLKVRQFDEAILDAYAQSGALAVEVDSSSADGQVEAAKLMVEKGFYKPGESLSQKLSKEDYRLYRKMHPASLASVADNCSLVCQSHARRGGVGRA